MTYTINSGGTNIAMYETKGQLLGMAQTSLDEHLQKHPDIASTPDEYLEKAAQILANGRPYKNGMLYDGIFARAYNSAEIGCPIVLTVHNRFRHQPN
ncbi:MAG: hypothetical protein KKF89_03290 [Nanoarchaeota archaeon]|nr:hypothetical protein [Nanoarchaeota archaeon]MBU1854720.1 hypothetical protein [Nanoarchaeota archaeon]